MTSMYTVCPKCALTLAVTAGDLRVAQGHVRCGRCSHVFNALTRLTSDDRQEEPQLKLTGSDTLDEALPEGVFEFNADASKVFAEPLPAPKWTPAGTYRGSAARNGASTRGAHSNGADGGNQGLNGSNGLNGSGGSGETAEFGDLEFDLTNDALTSATLETPILKPSTEPPAPMRRTMPPSSASATMPPRPSVPPRSVPPRSANVTRAPAPPRPVPPSNPTVAPRSPTMAPRSPTVAPRSPTVAPRSPTVAPRSPTMAPRSATVTRTSTVSPATVPIPRPTMPPAAATPIFPQQQPPVFPQQQPPVPVSAGVWTPRRRRMPDPDDPLPLQRPAQETTVTRQQALVLRQTSGPSANAAAQVDALLAAHAAKQAQAAAQTFLTRSPAGHAQRYRWGAVALAVLLALQAVNHYRDDLATNASLRGPVSALYGIFGIKLSPHWDLTAYDVRQLGPGAASGGQIMVRASIKNAARQPQPIPLLRITLQDKFGNPVAARDVLPGAYLPVTRQRSTAGFMSAGERIDAEIAFADPGPKASGYTIDACLPAANGGTACANQ